MIPPNQLDGRKGFPGLLSLLTISFSNGGASLFCLFRGDKPPLSLPSERVEWLLGKFCAVILYLVVSLLLRIVLFAVPLLPLPVSYAAMRVLLPLLLLPRNAAASRSWIYLALFNLISSGNVWRIFSMQSLIARECVKGADVIFERHDGHSGFCFFQRTMQNWQNVWPHLRRIG